MKEKQIHIRITLNQVVTTAVTFVVAAVIFIGANYVFATTPNPGHPWTDIGNGNWQVANTQTGTRTFTFPDADATVFTSANASTTLFSLYDTLYVGRTSTTTITSSAINLPTGGSFQINGASVLTNNTIGSGVTASSLTSLGTLNSLAVSGLSTFNIASSSQISVTSKAYFGGTATSTFDSTGALTLATPLGLSSGGTAASLSASNGGIVYSGASALAILGGTATAGQILQSGASVAPAWSTATYPSTAGSADNVLTSNGTNWQSVAATTSISQLTKGWGSSSGTSASAAQGTSLTIGTAGYFNVPVKITINQISIGVTIGGTTPSYTTKVCIYNDAGNKKFLDVTSGALTATGWFNITVSPAVTLYPGNYYIFEGLASQSGTSPTLTFNTWTTASIAGVNGASIPAGKVKYEGTIASRTSGVCDANLFSPGVLTNTNNATPIVRLDN